MLKQNFIEGCVCETFELKKMIDCPEVDLEG